MKDLNISISENGTHLLKSLIGQNFSSMKHEKFDGDNSVFQKVEIKVEKERYLIDNGVAPYDDYFGGPDDLPCLDFKSLKSEENPFDYTSDGKLSIEAVEETIIDIQIIKDHIDVLNGQKHHQFIDTSEGIIIITNRQEYGFFKENVYFDETLMIWKEKDVLKHIQPLKEHWNIFGYPFNAKCDRYLVSLKSGSEKKINMAEETGVIVNED